MTKVASKDPLPPSASISRFCRPKEIDELTGRPSHDAFHIRKKDEGKLSVDWLEIVHPSDRTTQIEGVTQSWMTENYSGGAFAIMNVDTTIKQVNRDTKGQVNLEVIYSPSSNSNSHSLILGSSNELHVQEAICDSVQELISL